MFCFVFCLFVWLFLPQCFSFTNSFFIVLWSRTKLNCMMWLISFWGSCLENVFIFTVTAKSIDDLNWKGNYCKSVCKACKDLITDWRRHVIIKLLSAIFKRWMFVLVILSEVHWNNLQVCTSITYILDLFIELPCITGLSQN